MNIKEKIDYSENGVLSKVISKTEKNNLTLFCMAAGTDVSEHTSTKEGFVYVIEGKGTFVLNSKEIKMEPGAIIFMNKNAPHSLKAEENTSFLLSLTN
jgi:quercetin dioxygenase-like cupin family protein